MFLVLAFSIPAFAQEKNPSGLRIYNEVCAVCHNAGVANFLKTGYQNIQRSKTPFANLHPMN
jgi:cytochrome c5